MSRYERRATAVELPHVLTIEVESEDPFEIDPMVLESQPKAPHLPLAQPMVLEFPFEKQSPQPQTPLVYPISEAHPMERAVQPPASPRPLPNNHQYTHKHFQVKANLPRTS